MSKKGLATRYIDGKWIVDVSLLLPNSAIEAVKNFIVKTQKSRLTSLSPLSDKYHSCLKSIEDAIVGKIEQRLVDEYGGTKGDLVAFSAKKPDSEKKIFSILGGSND